MLPQKSSFPCEDRKADLAVLARELGGRFWIRRGSWIQEISWRAAQESLVSQYPPTFISNQACTKGPSWPPNCPWLRPNHFWLCGSWQLPKPFLPSSSVSPQNPQATPNPIAWHSNSSLSRSTTLLHSWACMLLLLAPVLSILLNVPTLVLP